MAWQLPSGASSGWRGLFDFLDKSINSAWGALTFAAEHRMWTLGIISGLLFAINRALKWSVATLYIMAGYVDSIMGVLSSDGTHTTSLTFGAWAMDKMAHVNTFFPAEEVLDLMITFWAVEGGLVLYRVVATWIRGA